MDHKSKSKAGFLSLAEELWVYILRFLPCRDILRCTSVCKALRQTYMSSSELQYIVELTGQQLFPVHNTDDHTPISERLRLLRDKAHAWFKVNLRSFETVSIPKELYHVVATFVAHGHLCFWRKDDHVAVIIPIRPKHSQQIVERDASQKKLISITSAPHSTKLDVLIDPAQNLIAVVYVLVDETLYVDLRALDGDSVHPQAAGHRLFLSVLPGYGDHLISTESATLKCFGRHIALQRTSYKLWQLQIWDWRHSTMSNCFLSDDKEYPNQFFFLGNNRLLVLGDELNLYSIEDVSQIPQLLACFLMPISLSRTRVLAMDDKSYGSHPQIQKHRLLCIKSLQGNMLMYIISTRIFLDLDGMAVATPIPWTRWGPSNTRIFGPTWQSRVHLSENRVFQVIPDGAQPATYRLHMMDFSPLAVTNRRGLGRVVKEPTTININELSETGRPEENLTTSLPYVEVVSDRVFDRYELHRVWIDKDGIYLDRTNWNSDGSYCSSTLEVIDV